MGSVYIVGAGGIGCAVGYALLAGGIGGSITNPVNLASAEAWDPAAAKFTSVGSMSVARSGMSVVKMPVTDKILVAGGATGTSVTSPLPTDLAELFDPTGNAFAVVAPIPEPRAGAPAILLPTNHACLFGGVGVPTAPAIYRD